MFGTFYANIWAKPYSRGLTVDDAEHVQRILSDWEDWPLSDQKQKP